MRRWLRRVVFVLLLLATIGAAAVLVVYRMSQWEPSFYDKAIRMEPKELAQAGEELEQNVLALHNDVVEQDKWQVVISDEQINGWLAVDLPEKFPDQLPCFIKDPRVAIREGFVHVACRYEGPKLSAVVSVVVEPFLTDEANVLALRVHHARLGALPVLKRRIMERVAEEADRMGISLRWTQQENDPVALVTLALPTESEGEQVEVEFIELREGELVLSGSTPPCAPATDTSATSTTVDPAPAR